MNAGCSSGDGDGTAISLIQPLQNRAQHPFGVAQGILRLAEAWIDGSDSRGDGYRFGLLTSKYTLAYTQR